MRVGVPKEIKVHEYRVGLTPASVREVVAGGHRVTVEHDAGAGIGASDDDYRRAGAQIADTAEQVFASAELIVKVKEPQPQERAWLRPDHVLFTYLHLAPDPDQARDLIASGVTAIAYETVTDPGGGLPLLAPMSEVAGRMSVQAGAHCLEKAAGGRGVLLDNWDLSVKRATAVVRILQSQYGLDPAKMAAAGRGEYSPLTDNNTAEGRAVNRRTRIVILPQLDQFFKLLEPRASN
jgi:alanine dehydrogenase